MASKVSFWYQVDGRGVKTETSLLFLWKYSAESTINHLCLRPTFKSTHGKQKEGRYTQQL